MRKKMIAAFWLGPYQLELRDVDIPEIGSDDVLVEVKAAGICGTDLNIYRSRLAPLFGLAPPLVLGHENVGVIAEVGENVKNVKVGDRVALRSYYGCGKCYYCKSGNMHLCDNFREVGFTQSGGFAQYLSAPSHTIHILPDAISLVDAAYITSIAEPLHGIERVGIGVGDVVAVLGPGSIGLSYVQLVKLAGAKRVYVTGTREGRLSVAMKLGADEVINAKEEDPVKKILELTGGRGVDKVIEASGSQESIVSSTKMVRKGGKILLFGIPSKPVDHMSLHEAILKEIVITTCMSAGADSWEFEEAIELLAAGKFNVKPIITHVLLLSEIVKAFEMLDKRSENAIKVVLTP